MQLRPAATARMTGAFRAKAKAKIVILQIIRQQFQMKKRVIQEAI